MYYSGYYGPNVTYNQAVDGVMGKMTQAALDKRSKAEVINHSKKLNNDYEYKYLDTPNNKMYYIKNGNITDSIEVASGANYNFDGYNDLKMKPNGHAKYDRSLYTSATPGGVFVLNRPSVDRSYGGGTLSTWSEAGTGRKTNIAFHKAPSTRAESLAKGDRKLSYGCVYPANNADWDKFKEHNQEGDTIYSAMKEPGNYLMEVDGKIRPHFQSTSPDLKTRVWGSNVDIHDVKYNTGY